MTKEKSEKLETMMTEKLRPKMWITKQNFSHQHNPNLNNMPLFQSAFLHIGKFDPHKWINDKGWGKRLMIESWVRECITRPVVLNQGSFTPLPQGQLAMSADTSVVTSGASGWQRMLLNIPQSSGQPTSQEVPSPKCL